MDEMRMSFLVDELTTSFPLIREVNSRAEIALMFDTITYSKVRLLGEVSRVQGYSKKHLQGGSILRMVNSFMGEEYFLNGTRVSSDYLSKLQK